MQMLLRSNPELKGSCEVLQYDKFPANHPTPKKQDARIVTLIPDQVFLNHLQKFPASFSFNAGLCKRLCIRGGARINPNDPQAKKIIRGKPKFSAQTMEELT